MENNYNQFNNQNNNQIHQYMQKSNRKKYLYIIGPLVLLVALVGITYAFFNYMRTGSANSIKVGKVYFNTEQNGAFSLTNMFPIEPTQANLADNTKVGTVTIDVTGDTTYDNGIEYLVTAINVQNIVGTGNNQKRIPIGINVSYEASEDEEIGTVSNSYFGVRGGNTSYYKVLSNDTINEGDRLLVGYIAKGATGIDGTITIKAYFDSSMIAISDTYDGNESDNMGTTTNWVNGRTVLTTTEWNSLQTNGVSFQVKVEANEGIWVKEQIKYNANGGEISPSYKEIDNNATTYGNLPIPTRIGYIFDGWYTDPVNGTEVTASTSYTRGTSTTTLYAHWSQTAAGYLIDNVQLAVTPYGKLYTGASVNNYVIFNNEQWRILGVYTDSINGDRLKIIKSTPAYTGQHFDDDSNIWEDSTLETLLNNTYYNGLSNSAKEMIVDGAYHIGECSPSDNANTTYTNASSEIWIGKIGILSVYEYLYAAENDGTCWSSSAYYGYANGTSNNMNAYGDCGSKDWLKPDSDEWTLNISSIAGPPQPISEIQSNGGATMTSAVYDSGDVRPVVYLNPLVKITGGTGEPNGNEYTLSYTAS